MADTMHNITAVAGKELRSYFASPVAWVLMGFWAVVFGYFFNVYLTYFVETGMRAGMFGGPPTLHVNTDMIRPLLGNASVLVLFVLPMLTMRSYAEEKRSGTIELLLTSPLTDVEITLGKFLGAVGVYSALLLVTLVSIVILFGLGSPEWKPIAAGYLGLLLLGSSFLALGLFISSLTANQVIAGTVTFIVALLFWIINWAADTAGPTLGPILNYLSVTQHFDDFGKGVIDTKHLVFYLSFIVFGLFLTVKSLDTERWRG
ncbi:MAG: ABC transporter permease [Acidobacteriota bacterium]|jgi:ABC-2 type transport system permease protein|nr:MAG: ABC transporter [Acidobacteriota bacterium]